MKSFAYIPFVIASLLAGCVLVHARTAHTGHLFVSLTDRVTSCPITNAPVTVRFHNMIFNPIPNDTSLGPRQ